MHSKRYTVVIADRSTGVVRRLTVPLRPALMALVGVLAVPILIGLGARWSGSAQISSLAAARADLEMENASFRQATAELTSQITSLDAAIEELSQRSEIDATTLKAVRQLPALVRTRAAGGGKTGAAAAPLLAAAATSPENTFGILRDLLGALESRLRLVRSDVEQRGAVAQATPSIWPAHGWLSGGFGNRADPFTGEKDYHPALDISTDKGDPVYATADGAVESVAYNGNYGNLIVLDHGFGMVTRYGHLSKFNVKTDERVRRGQVIGFVGATGRATGAHLHYEVWLNGQPVNPLRLLTSGD